MEKLLWIFMAVWCYRFAVNASGWIRTVYYEKRYLSYIGKTQEKTRKVDFAADSCSVQKLFKQAGVPDAAFPYCEPIGYGKLYTSHVKLYANMHSLREDIVGGMLNGFSCAKGAYRMRLLECFSPLYWIECVLFLPSRGLDYIGVKTDSALPKIVQVIYWIAGPALLVFRADLYNYILHLFSQAH